MSFSPEISERLRERWVLSLEKGPESAARVAELDGDLIARYGRLVAPFVLDMSAFTLISLEQGVIHYLSMIRKMLDLSEPIVRQRGGTVVKQQADNLFASFDRPEEAIEAAAAIQSELGRLNMGNERAFDIFVSIGIGFGHCLILDGDVWGPEFNIAAKLGEDVADAGEILISLAAAEAPDVARRWRLEERPISLSGLALEAYRVIGAA